MEIIGVELHTCIIVTDMEGKYQDIQTAHGLWYTPVEMILPGPTSRESSESLVFLSFIQEKRHQCCNG
jgi:hypothetical protein